MGHNFGLSHDAPGCTCGLSYSSSNCVMADKLRLEQTWTDLQVRCTDVWNLVNGLCCPLSTGNLAFPEFFSDCSVEQLADFMARAQPNCLSKPPSWVKTIAVALLCGNHLLDAGEECDCGTVEVKLETDKMDVTTENLLSFYMAVPVLSPSGHTAEISLFLFSRNAIVLVAIL